MLSGSSTLALLFVFVVALELTSPVESFQRHRKSAGHRRLKRERRRNPRDQMSQFMPELAKEVASSDTGIETIEGSDVAKSRGKRATFAWPSDTLFIADFQLEMPFRTPEGVSIPFLVEAPYEFLLPNITDQVFFKRSINDRVNLFGTIEALFSRFGLDGHSCVLRAICERAENKIVVEGLLGEILNLVLAVSAIGDNDLSLMEFADAEMHGQSKGECAEAYSGCPFSLFRYY